MSTAFAYYNEIDEHAADWLENLIAAGMIAPGYVDRRSIKDVEVNDLQGFTQHHFFAGIGGWSYACRLAGWPDDRPIWTASCPCQPFSVAGKGLGEDDPRHLWPDLFRLWRAYRPAFGVGEQVAGKAGYNWFNGVRTDLEGENFIARAVDIPACAIDAPHQRNRCYWVCVANGEGEYGGPGPRHPHNRQINSDAHGALDDMPSLGRAEGLLPISGRRDLHSHGRNGTFWSGADWIICHDEKARRVADANAPMLVNGVSGRVAVPRPAEISETAFPEAERWVSRIGAWKGLGNAIVPQEGAEVIGALADVFWQEEGR